MNFSRSERLSKVTYDMRGPISNEAARMEAAGEKILKLNIGNLAPFGLKAPEQMIARIANELPNSEGYSDSRGIAAAREAIIAYHKGQGIKNISIADCYIGNGVSELINIVMMSLLNPGDEILIPAPDYPVWTGCAVLAGGKPAHYLCQEENGWMPDLADIEAKVGPKTKALLIINPNNPTGAVYSKEMLLSLIDIARRYNLLLFSDEIYDKILYDGEKHISTASLADDIPILTFNGVSKNYRACGLRGGWLVFSGDKERMKDYMAGVELMCNMRLCSNVPAQQAILAALSDSAYGPEELVAPGGQLYKRREAAYMAFNAIDGVSVVKGKGALYMFPKIDAKRFGIASDQKFIYDLLVSKKVLLTHGSSFNWPQPDHFRLVYLPDETVIAKVAENLADFLKTYKQN